MSRTTGYTCTACANMLIEKIFNEKGIIPLEIIGKNKINYDYIINYLKDRKVNLITNKKEKNGANN
jgi:saccharopine dehydrogenase-like NADP-dependent oxidoreductase